MILWVIILACCSLIVSTLSSVAAQASLGDTNTAVPGRLLGHVEACLEAGASEYVLKTILYGYKLVFKNAPHPVILIPITNLLFQNQHFFMKNCCVWSSWVALIGLNSGLILLTLAVSFFQRNGDVF